MKIEVFHFRVSEFDVRFTLSSFWLVSMASMSLIPMVLPLGCDCSDPIIIKFKEINIDDD
jgi:hypothetical protein